TRATRAIIAPWAEDEPTFPQTTQHITVPTTFYESPTPPTSSSSLDSDSENERPPTPPRKNSIPIPSITTREAAVKAAALLWGRRINRPLPTGFGKNVLDR